MTEEKKQSFADIFKGNIGVLTWTRFIFFFPIQLYNEWFPKYIEVLGGSKESIGIVSSLASFAAIFLAPIGGYLSDFHGRVKLIASAFYLRMLAYLIYMFSGSWVHLGFGKFYEGLTDYYHSAQSAIIADSLKPGRRAVGFAIVNQLPTAGSIVAPMIGAYVIVWFGLELGMRYLLFVALICMFAVGFCRGKFLKETLRRDNSEQVPRRFTLSIVKEAYRSSWEALKWTPKSLVAFVITQAISSFSGSMITPFWVIYGTDIIKLSFTDWGFMLLIDGLFALLISVPVGMIVDKVGNRRIIITMLFISIFPTFLFVYSKTFVQTLAVFLSTTLVTMFVTPACGAWLADTVPRQLRARVTAAYGRGGIGIRHGGGGGGWGYLLLVPSTLGAMSGGFIYSINPAYPWFIHAGSLSVCLIITILFVKEPEKPEI